MSRPQVFNGVPKEAKYAQRDCAQAVLATPPGTKRNLLSIANVILLTVTEGSEDECETLELSLELLGRGA